MRKRNLILDFTSLLDVIMIMLFLVMSSFGQSTQDKQNEYEKLRDELLSENASVIEKAERIANYNAILEEENNSLMTVNEMLSYENGLLSAENDYLRALNGESVDDKESLLRSIFNDSVRFILECTSEDEGFSSYEKVNISLFFGLGTDNKELSAQGVTILHDRSLSDEIQEKRNNEYKNALKKALKSILDDNGKELAVITVRLKKGDPAITVSDEDIIERAIRDLSSEEGIRCITDRMYY